jgi:multicomponent Na+:H+ antiporter subunit C
MEWIAALTTGGMAGFGLWMLLDRNLKRVVLGVAVLGNAINLGVITAGRFGGKRHSLAQTAQPPNWPTPCRKPWC